MHLVCFETVFRVVMQQALCDNPNNGCEGDPGVALGYFLGGYVRPGLQIGTPF